MAVAFSISCVQAVSSRLLLERLNAPCGCL